MKQADISGRFTTPIAASATAANCADIPTAQTTAGDGSASMALGFPPETFTERAAGGVPPRGADMNGFLKTLSAAIQVLQTGYVGPFDASFAAAIGGYPAGAVVAGSVVGTFWVSGQDNNLSTPGAQGAAWVNLFSGLLTSAQAAQSFFPLTGGKISNGYYDSTGTWGGSGSNGAPQAGDTPWGPQFISRLGYSATMKALFCLRDAFEQYAFASVQLTDAAGGWHEWQFRQDGSIRTPDGAVVATQGWANGVFQPAGSYVGLGTYQADFATQDGRVINLPYGQRIQSFSVSIQDGDGITFPQAFAGVPTSVQLQCMQYEQRMTLAMPEQAPTATGIGAVGVRYVVDDHDGAVSTPITVWVTAIGPR